MPRKGLHRLPFETLGLALLAALTSPCLSAEAFRRQVEDDWTRQDARRVAQIREPGLVRFVETELNWPGVKPDDRLRVPEAPGPQIDGRLDDACWQRAARLPAADEGQPSLWLLHDREHLYVGLSMPTHAEASFQGCSTALDAAGAVDGVTNGRYAFHTGQEPNPWWQVDLGARRAIGKIVVYNRLDYRPGLHNADNLLILTSDDGKQWKLIHDNQGRHFGGVSGGGPLVVDLAEAAKAEDRAPVEARFVRLQVRSPQPIFFHLDEVEVYGADDPGRNLALHRPARQSSLSIWSRGGNRAGSLFALGKLNVRFDKDQPDRLLIGDASLAPDKAGLLRHEGQTSIEVAVPLAELGGQFPSELLSPAGKPIPLTLGGNWRIAVHDGPELGFGRNRLSVELEAEGPLDPPVELSVESVVFTPFRPERQTAFRATFAASASVPIEFSIDHEGPAAVIVAARQGEVAFADGRVFFVEPVRETIARAERLLDAFERAAPAPLDELGRRAEALARRESTDKPDPGAREALYREARWLARAIAFQNPRLDFGELLFVKRFTQETYPDVCLNHMPWVSRPGGDLCVLSMVGHDRQGEVRNLLEGKLGPGHVHGMDLWYDADRVVFGYAKAKSNEPPAGWLDRRTSFELRRNEEPTHIFEIGVDGRGLRQLTEGEWSDLDPTYVPSGEVAFVSERCGCSLQCNEYDKDETSCNLYVMGPDGGNVRRLSVTKDGDYLPHAFSDGSIGYTRWEYQERGWAHIQSIWYVRPDGTGADALFKQHFNDPWALEDVRSVPGGKQIAAIATGHHTLAAGPVVLVNHHRGVNNPEGIAIITPGVDPPEGGMSGTPVAEGGVPGKGGFYMHPWPLSETTLLASYCYDRETNPTGYALYLIDVFGTKELVYRDPAISCFSPIPLRRRPRPLICADATDPSLDYATCSVANVGYGVEGVAPESIRYLRISQRLQWPYCNTFGGQRYEPDVKSVMINWTPARVLGEVPVEADGSAHFVVPADTAVYFQLLDENHMELRRMRSFLSFQPGEARACHGCHETRGEAPQATVGAFPIALLREPSTPAPPPWGTRPISFFRDVQPIFDRLCAGCHGGLEPAAGLDFSGGLTAGYNRAYDTITAHGLVARSNVGDDAKITPPLAFGSHKSKLVDVLRSGPCGSRARLSDEDWLRLVIWIDANAPYHDGFINKRQEVPPYDLPNDRDLAADVAAVHAKRCAGCHEAAQVSRLDWIDLDDPARSRFLAAPLPADAGGTGRCGKPVYPDRSDPDYARLLERVVVAANTAWERPRRDLKTLDSPRASETRRVTLHE